MNFLLSIFILFLSHEIFSSQKYEKLSETDETIEALAIPIENNETISTLLTTYTNSRIYLEDQRDSALHERNEMQKKLVASTDTVESLNKEIRRLQTISRTNESNAIQKNTQINTLNNTISQLEQQIRNFQNEEFVDLSCSIVGPRFLVLPCFKSQPLPKHITATWASDGNEGCPHQILYYYDTKKQRMLNQLTSLYCFTASCYGACCIQKKLPQDIEIRQSINYPEQKAYFSKYDHTELETTEDCTWIGCYNNCCKSNHQNDFSLHPRQNGPGYIQPNSGTIIREIDEA